MINIEFETFEEVSEITKTVNRVVEDGLGKNKKYVDIVVGNLNHKIDIKSNEFKAGLLYGLSISKELK
jgi:hypothetical protein